MKVLHVLNMQRLSLKPLWGTFLLCVAAAIVKGIVYIAKNFGIDSPDFYDVTDKIIFVLLSIAAMFAIRWLIVEAPFNLLRKYTIAPFLKTIITILLYVATAIYILHYAFLVNLLPLFTTSAVLTGIIALSLQDTLKNLFTGLWLNMERVVAKGDWVSVSGKEGQIIEITWRTTRIATRDNSVLQIPNRIMAENLMENFTFPTPHHVVTVTVGAGYNDPPNKVKELLLDIAKNSTSVLKDPPPEVWITKFGDYYIQYKLRCWIEDFRLEPDVITELNSSIWYAFRRAKIEIPYPEQTIAIKRFRATRTSENIHELIKNIDFLTSLPENQLKLVATSARVEQFGAGEVIVKQGDVGDSCYFISDGSVNIIHRNHKGTDEKVAYLEKGDLFGEMSLLTGAPRNATVNARTDTECIVIDSMVFERIFAENPEVAEKLSVVLARRLVEHKNALIRAEARLLEEQDRQKTILASIKRFFKIN